MDPRLKVWTIGSHLLNEELKYDETDELYRSFMTDYCDSSVFPNDRVELTPAERIKLLGTALVKLADDSEEKRNNVLDVLKYEELATAAMSKLDNRELPGMTDDKETN